MKKIGYLGPPGTFSHEAAKKYIRLTGAGELVPRPSIPDLMTATDSGVLQEAILPIENSLEGGVIPTLDMFMEELDVQIRLELLLPIRENLLVKPGTERGDIRVVTSHSQPLGQCRKFLQNAFPTAHLEAVGSTAIAAETVQRGDGSVAAIGGVASAELYGLEILEADIQDEADNVTRFIVIGKEDSPQAKGSKSSLIFGVSHRPGSLYQILDIFSIFDINMTRIESRPAKRALGEYVFYVDIDGHRDDPDVADALKMIRRKAVFYKFLGSYGTVT